MAGAGREDVRAVHPRERTPAHRVEADVDVEHRGHRLRRGWWGRALDDRGWRERLEERADDEEERAHADSGDQERELATD